MISSVVIIGMETKKLNFALQDNRLVHILEVESGLICNCVCMNCNQRLVAKKGMKNIHHFAHYNSEECEGAFESALHHAAKEIIKNSKTFAIPDIYLQFIDSYKEPLLLEENKVITVDKISLEKRISDVIPDIILEVNGHMLFVEIYVTHKIDSDKLRKIKRLGISTIEIDLSAVDDNMSKEELENLLIKEVNNKYWVFSNIEKRMYKRFRAVARRPMPVHKGYGRACPLNLYFWNGISSARWVDCLYCDYCFDGSGSGLCLGFSLIKEVTDFDIPKEDREKQLKIMKLRNVENLIKEGYCPKCLNGIVERKKGRYGYFEGCSNYPDCNYNNKTEELILLNKKEKKRMKNKRKQENQSIDIANIKKTKTTGFQNMRINLNSIRTKEAKDSYDYSDKWITCEQCKKYTNIWSQKHGQTGTGLCTNCVRLNEEEAKQRKIHIANEAKVDRDEETEVDVDISDTIINDLTLFDKPSK